MVSEFLASQGQETKTVFALEDHYRDSPQMAEAVARMKADPAVGRLISEGYTTPDYDLDALAKYPPGSLAHTYAKLMRLVGYSAKFYPEREIKSDADYCIMRVRKTHELDIDVDLIEFFAVYWNFITIVPMAVLHRRGTVGPARRAIGSGQELGQPSPRGSDARRGIPPVVACGPSTHVV